MDNLIGKVLSSRYEIIEKIGDGGMALVYKAKDRLLNRFVAVKILKNEFAVNEEFVTKFEKEAQASAGLSHPNIVNIYDVGQDGQTNFIVMEFVDGITLREFIKTKRSQLHEFDIVSISKQIAEALSHAHKNHIIHRDIKSQNILITENLSIKVADFGIARALTTATLTATKEIMGSVHYSSPEQARGSYVDERSDIYSLGVVLYEMVTGVLPFDGETPVAVALQHMKEDIIPPSDYNSSLSIGLESIIYKSMMKMPQDRFQSAPELINDLTVLLQNPSAVFNYFSSNASESPTMILPDAEALQNAISSNEEESFVVASSSLTDEAYQEVEMPSGVFKIKDDAHMDPEPDGTLASNTTGSSKKPKREKKIKKKNSFISVIGRKDVWIPLVAGVVFALLLVFGGFQFITGMFNQEKLIEVPNVVNTTYEEAKRKIEDAGLSVTMGDQQFSDDIVKNNIISQDISGGGKVKAKTLISLVVSKGPDLPIVPSVVAKTLDEARLILQNAGFAVGDVSMVESEMPIGQVVEQTPGGLSTLEKGQSVDLQVSQGKKTTISMPSLTGKSLINAKATLKAVNLSSGNVTYDFSNNYSSGKIMIQSIKAGSEVEEGSSVDLVISKGPKEVITQNTTKTFKVPFDQASADTFTLKVVKIVNGNEEVVYQKNQSKADAGTSVSVTSAGTTTIKFYFDNELINSITENF